MQRFPGVNPNSIFSIIFIIIISLFINTYSEPVAKFAWKGSLSGLAEKTLEVPLGTVAMSEYIYVSTVLDNLTEKDPCSIMFIIDNSASNFTDETDVNCERYRVVSELVDLIYAKAPETKVGLILFGSRLWMYNQDDPIFSTHSGDGGTGAYIEPLNLDQMYEGRYRTCPPGNSSNTPSEQFNYNKSGKDVLQLYLETVPYTFMSKSGRKSKYQPVHSPSWPDPTKSHGAALTNISRAFEAAKEAHLNQSPSLNASRHFNIFFSDGKAGVDATNPDYGITNKYIGGVDVPTTFTIFYKADADALAALNSMTNNIKTNGYSINNNLSNIWNLTDWDNIKSTLENDVFNKILSKTTGSPTEITIKTESETNWDSTGFKYKDLFPLQKDGTPFDINLKIHIKRDSLDDLGNIIKSEEKDTNLIVNFEVAVKDIPQPDSMEIIQWGRDMFLFHQNDTVKQADSQMDNLEVRFEPYKIDTTFGYSDIEAIVKSKDAGDSETLNLTAQGTYFTNNFNIEVQGTSTKDNGTLNLSPVDSIILIYENPDLPLDTIRKAIYFTDAVEFSITKASYFDENADGNVDLVKVDISGSRVNDYKEDIYNAITFDTPDISKESYTLNSSTFEITVQSSESIKTHTDENDIVRISDTVSLSQGSKILPSLAVALDSMAPVIIDALFIDSIKESSLDEIQIKFSEDVNNESDDDDLKFIKSSSNNSFDVTLNHISSNGSEASYFISSIESGYSIEENDSTWINSTATSVISDEIPFEQSNANNRKCPIRIKTIPDGIIISKASYLDENANGRIDHIVVEWSDETGVIDGDLIEAVLNLPSVRLFSISDISCYNNYINIEVVEGSPNINTAVSSDEKVEIIDTLIFSETIRVLPSSVNVTDSLAPVIMSATYEEGDQNTTYDKLTVHFSEDINQNDNTEQFKFCKNDNSQYRMTVQLETFNTNNAEYRITDYPDNIKPVYGDSIWIHTDAKVMDISSESNIQNNNNNIKRPLSINLSCLMVKAVYKEEDNFSDGLIDFIEIDFDKDINKERAEKIVESLILPTSRNLSFTGSYSYENKTLTVSVNETGTPNSAIDNNNDILKINIIKLDSITIYEHTILIEDELPPVITEGFYKPGKSIGDDENYTDTLILNFSETVNIPSNKSPFNFIDITTEDEYEMELECITENPSRELKFLVLSSTKIFPQSGDSIWIDFNKIFTDLINNTQNRDNIKVPLKVGPYPYRYDILVYPNPFTYNKHYKNFEKVAEKYLLTEDQGINKNTIVILAIPKGRVPSNLEPTGSITFYDAVGNYVNTLREMKFNPESGCVYALWEKPQNSKGREMGSGLLVFKLQLNDGNGETVELESSLGIKRND